MIKIIPLSDLYTELYDNAQSNIIHTVTKEVPDITPWQVEAAVRDMKTGTATGNDHINIELLKAREDTISKTLAKQYLNAYHTDEYRQRGRTTWKDD